MIEVIDAAGPRRALAAAPLGCPRAAGRFGRGAAPAAVPWPTLTTPPAPRCSCAWTGLDGARVRAAMFSPPSSAPAGPPRRGFQMVAALAPALLPAPPPATLLADALQALAAAVSATAARFAPASSIL